MECLHKGNSDQQLLQQPFFVHILGGSLFADDDVQSVDAADDTTARTPR